MKYVISESRFDKAIDAYLASRLEPHELVEFKVPKDRKKKKYWIVNNIVVGEFENIKFENSKMAFWIDEKIFNSLRNYFSLSERMTVNHIKRYLLEHYNIKYTEVGSYNFGIQEQRLYNEYGKK